MSTEREIRSRSPVVVALLAVVGGACLAQTFDLLTRAVDWTHLPHESIACASIAIAATAALALDRRDSAALVLIVSGLLAAFSATTPWTQREPEGSRSHVYLDPPALEAAFGARFVLVAGLVSVIAGILIRVHRVSPRVRRWSGGLAAAAWACALAGALFDAVGVRGLIVTSHGWEFEESAYGLHLALATSATGLVSALAVAWRSSGRTATVREALPGASLVVPVGAAGIFATCSFPWTRGSIYNPLGSGFDRLGGILASSLGLLGTIAFLVAEGFARHGRDRAARLASMVTMMLLAGTGIAVAFDPILRPVVRGVGESRSDGYAMVLTDALAIAMIIAARPQRARLAQ